MVQGQHSPGNFNDSTFEIGTLAVIPLTSGAFLSKMRFLDILVVFRLDFGQISFNLAQKPFATQQSFLPLASRFTAFRLGHAQKSNV